jgi:hypothetical protein
MRLPRFRARLWMLMAFVAWAAVGMGLERRRTVFLDRAEHHARMDRMFRHEAPCTSAALGLRPESLIFLESDDLSTGAGWAAYRGVRYSGDKPIRELVAALSGLAIHHAGLRDKYACAADHPWLPLSADPPMPGLPQGPDLGSATPAFE